MRHPRGRFEEFFGGPFGTGRQIRRVFRERKKCFRPHAILWPCLLRKQTTRWSKYKSRVWRIGIAPVQGLAARIVVPTNRGCRYSQWCLVLVDNAPPLYTTVNNASARLIDRLEFQVKGLEDLCRRLIPNELSFISD